jgi:ATP-dependent DNA ligase
LGLEGIVSKRATSRYKSGRCDTWRKVKNPAYERALLGPARRELTMTASAARFAMPSF